MGLGIVLFFWIVVGGILGVVGTAVSAGLVALLTRGATFGRKRAMLLAALFPFVCLGWAGVVFVFQATVNATMLQRDIGIGDSWYTPLPNGYSLLMIDVTDYGTICKARQGSIEPCMGDQSDALQNVTKLQLAGRYMLGSTNQDAFGDIGTNARHPDMYFVFDTVTQQRDAFSNYDAFRIAASALRIRPSLEPIVDVYSRYRFTWFEVFVGVLLVLPPTIAATFGLLWLARLRRRRALAPA